MGKTAKTKSKVKVHRIIESRTDFFYYAFCNVLLISIPLLTVSGLVLSHLSFHSSATSSGSDNLAITISSSCTLSSVVNIPHNAEVYNGNYLGDIGKTTITTLCNDSNGYSVYAVGYSNNEEGNNKLINSEYPQYSIDTGLAASGLTSAWAMKLNNIPDDPSPTPPTIESDYNNTYGIVLAYWTKVASRASGTTDMAQGSSFTTTYAVYASSSQHAGTYIGQVKYVLTHPYSNDKYRIYMQEVDKWKSSLALEESVQAIDMRDGKKYWVTKLKDGNIWMTQNLDFDIKANTTLNSNTTDLNVAYDSSTRQYTEYNDGYTESNGVIYYTPANSANTIDFIGTNVPGWQNSNTAPYSANKTDSTETGHASLGNYYNWTAAIASNNSSSLTQDTLSDISKNPKNSICPKGWRLPTISNQSEALPGSTNEFARLNYLYNENKTNTDAGLTVSPLLFIRSGRVNNNSFEYQNAQSFYWYNANSTSSYAYTFSFTNNTVALAGGQATKGTGRSLRCLAR